MIVSIGRVRRLSDCYSVDDLRLLAHRRVPAGVFHTIDGGGYTELTSRRNVAAFDDVKLISKGMVDVSHVDTFVNILGQKLAFPLYCGPTGMSRLYHKDGELAVARAAAAAGTLYGASMVASYTHERIARETTGPKMLQIYIFKDRGLTMDLVRNARASAYSALCLTIDTANPGARYRDNRTGMTVPPKLTARTVVNALRHGRWLRDYLMSEPLTMASLARHLGDTASPTAAAQFMGTQLDPSVTWNDARAVVEAWGGAFAIKGVMHPDDARMAIDIGASAIIVSNHGGRQFDGGAAPIEALPGIAKAVQGRAQIILDGGVRSGMHVLKALALGADAVSCGRPYLFGLAAGGEQGVAKVLAILSGEIRSGMALMGVENVSQIGREFVLQQSGHTG